MAQEVSRFWDFDSVKNNAYQADEFAEFFRTFFTDGLPDLGTNLQVTAPDTGMIVNMGYGAAVIQGTCYWLKDNNTGIKTLPIAAANASNPRIDRVILRRDKSSAIASIALAVLTGVPAANPVPLNLTRLGNIYEISLAQVRVNAGVLSIAADKVTDERPDNNLCGLVESWKVRNYLDQGVKTTDSPTFQMVTATIVKGAVFQ